VKDAKIYNNTIYVGKGYNVDILQHADWKGWADSTYVYNNIFYVDGTAEIAYGISRDPDGAYVTAHGFGPSKNNVLDYNIYFGNIKASGEEHGLTIDPMLEAPGHSGPGRLMLRAYRLRAGSPALNSGMTIGDNGGKDFVGTPVPSCKGVDRGAVESSCDTN
jgi:hypothetical protein